ncbi:MAG TPA: RNA polymerase factor sigma-54 [Gammaproteobacteria bacterium]|nr:RNA polymerase factor sigma-54 [Gammaproteobacteria bacterium]
MKQSLQLRLGQHLTMTPQLQQAIRLLQLSTVELQSEIQEALESNPMLEEGSEEGGSTDSAPSIEQKQAETSNADPVSEFEVKDSSSELQSDSLPADLPVDSSWEDTYDYNSSSSSSTNTYNSSEDNLRDFESKNTVEDTLTDHLLWQLNLTPFSDIDRTIASVIIDSLNEDGYLAQSLEDILNELKTEENEENIELDEVEAVLHRLQNFDPPGIAARDLRESLKLQLAQLSEEDIPLHAEASKLIDQHFDLLANRDFNLLMRRMKLTEDKLKQVVEVIHTLNPRPGSQVASSTPEYIIPDVYVRKEKNAWRVSLNPDTTPKLNINSMYAGLIQRADKSPDNTYMQGQLQEARWLIKSLQSRNETLMKVSTCIVARQKGFLEHGEEAMKALVLHDVAEEVGMHESTISRITNKKYMHTPRGIFELKYFFSSHVSTASGGECSSTAIRALIKKLIAAETPKKPLSDSKIAKILSDQGINVARRTVAKYRDAMTIPPSNERKRLA